MMHLSTKIFQRDCSVLKLFWPTTRMELALVAYNVTSASSAIDVSGTYMVENSSLLVLIKAIYLGLLSSPLAKL